MPNLLVRDVPERVMAALKRRAADHHRSLQQEMLEILEEVAEETSPQTAADRARIIRQRLAGQYGTFPDSTPLIRADRER
ncbi:MAG TPA: Arc family DNA-binding protein [Chloroflexota bacterium]|nr:Arc family DNA-binding protein [Chloroflexota bacterium]